MRTTPKTRFTLPRLATLAIAAGLAVGAGASHAGAIVNITSFTVTPGDAFSHYAFADGQTQSYTSTALNQGGLGPVGNTSSATFSDNNWGPHANTVAQTTPNFASAVGVHDIATDNAGLSTPMFGLSSTALRGNFPSSSPANTANASALMTGSFGLFNYSDDSTAVGTLTFDVAYVLSYDGLADFDVATVTLHGRADDLADDFDDTVTLTSPGMGSGAGTTSGHFIWTVSLSADEWASFTLSGTAQSAAVNVPEPSALALASLALLALGVTGRKSKTQAATA